jgi:hypothetical protein
MMGYVPSPPVDPRTKYQHHRYCCFLYTLTYDKLLPFHLMEAFLGFSSAYLSCWHHHDWVLWLCCCNKTPDINKLKKKRGQFWLTVLKRSLHYCLVPLLLVLWGGSLSWQKVRAARWARCSSLDDQDKREGSSVPLSPPRTTQWPEGVQLRPNSWSFHASQQHHAGGLSLNTQAFGKHFRSNLL